jgi:serine/threonine protein phosphatase PrpC
MTTQQSRIVHVRSAGLSDIGVVREENQDAYAIQAPADSAEQELRGWLFVVADGMGGLTGGREASGLAIQTLPEIYYGSEGEAGQVLRDAVEEANRRIHARSLSEGNGQPMGSTVTAIGLFTDRAFVAQVGDSRAYRFRAGRLQQITRDHSLLRELQDRGHSVDESGLMGVHRNFLTRGLGLREEVEVDIFEIADVRPGDIYVLSTDGLHEIVGDERLCHTLEEHSDRLESACADLIAEARSRGGPDNITVVLARVDSGPETAMDGPSTQKSAATKNSAATGQVPRYLPIVMLVSFLIGAAAAVLFIGVWGVRTPARIDPNRAAEIERHLDALRNAVPPEARGPGLEGEIRAIRNLILDE